MLPCPPSRENSLEKKLTWRETENEVQNPADLISAPRSSPTWPSSLGNFQLYNPIGSSLFYWLKFQMCFCSMPGKDFWQILHECHLWTNLIGETIIKRNITKMSGGISRPFGRQVPGQDSSSEECDISHGFFSFPGIWAAWPHCPAPEAETAPSTSTLNPLKSRTWNLSTSQHTQKHLWAIQIYLKILTGRWGRHSAHPTAIHLKLPHQPFLVLPSAF